MWFSAYLNFHINSFIKKWTDGSAVNYIKKNELPDGQLYKKQQKAL